MALVTSQPSIYDFGAFTVRWTCTYDNVSLFITRFSVTNGGPAACTIIVVHPTTGQQVSTTVPAGSTRNLNVPNNTYQFGSENEGVNCSMTFYPQGGP